MNVEDLRDWLQDRLDKQDESRGELHEEVVQLRVKVGELEATLQGHGKACEARHSSSEKKIGVIRGILIAVGMGTVGTAAATLWAKVFPSN